MGDGLDNIIMMGLRPRYKCLTISVPTMFGGRFAGESIAAAKAIRKEGYDPKRCATIRCAGYSERDRATIYVVELSVRAVLFKRFDWRRSDAYGVRQRLLHRDFGWKGNV